jgi:hypothetical protein
VAQQERMAMMDAEIVQAPGAAQAAEPRDSRLITK